MSLVTDAFSDERYCRFLLLTTLQVNKMTSKSMFYFFSVIEVIGLIENSIMTS
jgi:hypothetical protein